VVLAARHYHNLLDGVGLLGQVMRPLHFLVALDWITGARTRAVMEALAHWADWPVTLRSEEFRSKEVGLEAAHRCAYERGEVVTYQRRAYRRCLDLLRDGRALVTFPEGYPVIDPHANRERRSTILAPFKSGFARLAVTASRTSEHEVNVVPVGIRVDDPPARALTFVYGHARQATASSDIDTLTAGVYDDVLKLSAPAE